MKKRRIGAALLAGAMLFCLPTPVNAQTEAQTEAETDANRSLTGKFSDPGKD